MMTIRTRTLALAVGVAVALAIPASPAEADLEAAYQKLVQEREATLVTVKFVLKIKLGGMGDQESEQEVEGLMIEPGGLVLVSNTQLAGFVGLMRRFSGGMGGDISAIPTDLKVLVGEDTEGLEAELLARDTELDLAWVRIKDPGERSFAALDWTQSTKPKLGQRLLTLGRMGKYFDRATVVRELRVAGFVSKPRELIVPSGDAAGLGMPVYTADGQLVGLTILQLPEVVADDGSPFGMLSQMSDLDSSMGGLILPAEDVLKATSRAKDTAAEQEAEPDESMDEDEDGEQDEDEPEE